MYYYLQNKNISTSIIIIDVINRTLQIAYFKAKKTSHKLQKTKKYLFKTFILNPDYKPLTRKLTNKLLQRGNLQNFLPPVQLNLFDNQQSLNF